MKKLVCVILAFLIIVLSTASCTEPPTITEPSFQEIAQFEILEIGSYDSSSNANHTNDLNVSDTKKVEKNVAKTKSIVIDGKSTELTYKETVFGYFYHAVHDTYQNGAIIADFNRDTGVMDFYCNASLVNKNADDLSRDECLAVAQEHLRNYAEDVEKYTLTEEKYHETSKYYSFVLTRTIDEIKTYDFAIIYVTQQGKVWLYSFASLGEMRDAVLPPQETMAEIRAGLDERLDKIYSPIMDKYTVSYELDEEVFLRLADGSYALKYDYAVTLTPKAGEGVARSELTSLLVRLS